jgi:hypothetical protein
MAYLSIVEQYYKLADMLIEKATKEQLAECARLLALNLAHYKAKHGELALDETLALVDMSEPNEAQAQLLAAQVRKERGTAQMLDIRVGS